MERIKCFAQGHITVPSMSPELATYIPFWYDMHTNGEDTVKPVLSGHSKRTQKLVLIPIFGLSRSKVLQDAPLEHSAILSTFIQLPFSIKTIVLYIFEWSLKTGFTTPSNIQ